MTKDFSVVGIGASAGGLKAITEFFSHMPNDTGLAFVVIQHLSPDLKSLMDELLAKHTDMPIQVIDKNVQVKANSIYLISPKSNIIIDDGVIKNVDRQAASALNLPIDIFFHSLGKDLKEKSIGVILSGTGTDGSRGIRTIKEEGGMIFVQDPDSAQFDGMPNAAVMTNLVDTVASPANIATKIAGIIGRPELGQKPLLDIEEMTDLEIFKQILEIVRVQTNIDFAEYRQNTLIRRLEKRMYLNHVNSISEYYDLITERQSEVKSLFNEFLIGVTRFFRDKEAFDILNDKVLPAMIAAIPSNEDIRIWCVGCSSGEEAYSIGILLKEYFNKQRIKRKFKIFATDIDKMAIKKASAGVYPEGIVADVGSELIERYFIQQSNGYSINKGLRESLIFTVHDALSDPPFINIDLLICRNMMIYLNPAVQKKLLTNFRFSLEHKGYLFLGPSESITAVKNAFLPVSTRWNIFQHVSMEKPMPSSRSVNIEIPALRKKGSNGAGSFRNQISSKDYQITSYDTEDFIAQAISLRYGPRSIFVNDQLNIVYTNGDFRDILQFPSNFANLNLLSRLRPEEHLLFRNGVRQALNERDGCIYENVEFSREENKYTMNVQFSSFDSPKLSQPLVWITFHYADARKNKEEKGSSQKVIGFDNYENERLGALEYELGQIKKEKQFLVEQLEAANEELQSSNEELLAANEELQSTNEELQSVNEELYTVNTELQSKINELVISNNDITNLLKSIDIGIIFLDKDLRIRKFTPALKEQFDLEESDIGRSISNFTNAFSLDIKSEIHSLFQDNKPIEREIKDLNNNAFLMRVLPYQASDKLLDGAVISFINFNEIKAARRAIQQNANKFEEIFNHVQDIILTLDTEGTIITMNSGFDTGYKVSDLVGEKFYEVTNADQDIRYQALQKLLRTKQPVFYEIDLLSPDGKRKKWFDVTLVPILHEDSIESAILIAHDITVYKSNVDELQSKSDVLEQELFERNMELESAIDELKEANSYLDSFVHGAAHDLRAPLANMKGMIDLLPKIEAPEKKNKILTQFQASVNSMDNTLNGLIELIEFQKSTAEMISPVDPVEVFKNTEEQLQKEVANGQLQIKTDIDFDGVIHHIPAYVQSIFYNLLSNAYKYRKHHKPAKVQVSIKRDADTCIIKVSDDGLGMDLERYGHLLFKPFKRLTVRKSGMGIGLSIINSAIKKTGGKIEVESQIGKGAAFVVHLPDMKNQMDTKEE